MKFKNVSSPFLAQILWLSWSFTNGLSLVTDFVHVNSDKNKYFLKLFKDNCLDLTRRHK